jgi:hypothetical protein
VALRRSRKAQGPAAGAAPAPSVSFDAWSGDPELPVLRASLEAGDREPLAEAYAAADPHRREVLVHQLTLEQPRVACLDTWPDDEPELALAHLLRGSQRIGLAWAARGHGRSQTVGESAWDVFFDGLRAAEQDLQRAVQLDDDGVGWSTLLVSGRGLQLTLDELRARYARATTTAPGLAFAADQLLQSLCTKWFGSADDSFAFAREIAASAPDGDPRHRLIAMAHVEHGIAIDDQVGRDAYRLDPDAQREVLAAAERCVFADGFGDGVQERRTLNWCAMALGYFRSFDEARPLLERIGASPTVEPWAYFADGAAGVVASYREQAGLAAL